MAHKVTEEARAEIIHESSKLTTGLTARAKSLAEQFPYSWYTIRLILKKADNTIPVKKPVTEEQKQQMRVLYSLSEGKLNSDKIRDVMSKTGWCHRTVRLAMKESEPAKERMYSPLTHPFI